MTISRKWWEPEPQDPPYGSEGRSRQTFDLGDLLSLAIGGGEFAHLADLVCCAGCYRQPTANPFPLRDAPSRARRSSDE